MSKTHKPGERIIPLDHERDPNVFTKAAAIQMPESPITVKPLPQPDKIEQGSEPQVQHDPNAYPGHTYGA